VNETTKRINKKVSDIKQVMRERTSRCTRGNPEILQQTAHFRQLSPSGSREMTIRKQRWPIFWL
jgi:hypothetical protein